MSGSWPKPLPNENRGPVKHCIQVGTPQSLTHGAALPSSCKLHRRWLAGPKTLSSSQGVITDVLECMGKVSTHVCSGDCLKLRPGDLALSFTAKIVPSEVEADGPAISHIPSGRGKPLAWALWPWVLPKATQHPYLSSHSGPLPVPLLKGSLVGTESLFDLKC